MKLLTVDILGNHKCCTRHCSESFNAIRRCLAFPWKLNVSTNSPLRVSLCRTRKMPWPVVPLCSTRLAASDRLSVPWNHGKSLIVAVKSASDSKFSKSTSVNSKLLDVDVRVWPSKCKCILFAWFVIVVVMVADTDVDDGAVSFKWVVLPHISFEEHWKY